MDNPISTSDVGRAGSFCCYRLDPTHDRRWSVFVDQHPRSSIFHTPGWLEALRRTYGYEPTVFTTSPPTGPLTNGIVFCGIQSWLTGNRLVSLPFSDHCEPLCDSQADLDFLIRYLRATVEDENWKYLEVRQIDGNIYDATASESEEVPPTTNYFLHVLDLRPNLDEVLAGLDKDSVQRRIRHAESAGLAERCGRSEELLKEFFALFVETRGRHHLPPTPYAWFRNLVRAPERRPGDSCGLQRRDAYLCYSDAAIQGCGLLQVRLLHSEIQQIRSHSMAPLASDRIGQSERSNGVRHGAYGRRKHRLTYLQKPLGPSAAALGLLAISGRSFAQPDEWLEIEDGEAGVFDHAGRIANHGRQNDLSPYRIESEQAIKMARTRYAMISGCLLRIKH